jgi:hypothetical protein
MNRISRSGLARGGLLCNSLRAGFFFAVVFLAAGLRAGALLAASFFFTAILVAIFLAPS